MERTMTTFIHKLTLILTIAIALAVSPLCGAFSECEHLGEVCGDPPFLGCCSFDKALNNEGTIQLDCKDDDNDGIGTCEIEEDSEDSDNSEDSDGSESNSNNSEKKESKSETKSQ